MSDELVVIYKLDEIRRLMWTTSGCRTDKRLQRASARLRNLQREIHDFLLELQVSYLLELAQSPTVAAVIVDRR